MKIGIVDFHSFDWDIGNFLKVRKHGVSIEELEEFFTQELLYFEDERHSGSEERYIAIGENRMKRTLFVAFTFRQKGHESSFA